MAQIEWKFDGTDIWLAFYEGCDKYSVGIVHGWRDKNGYVSFDAFRYGQDNKLGCFCELLEAKDCVEKYLQEKRKETTDFVDFLKRLP